MNQLCRVCGEPAAGFHFGAFTCEGCKSFFGRTCNNVSSLGECKNGGKCIINRKNRTACKSCRLRKCLSVGMSKSGSRYGRRSNWFKIHCLLQDQANPSSTSPSSSSSSSSSVSFSIEETKRLLDKLQSSNIASPDSLHDKDTKSDDLTSLPDEGNCSSSPTVSSTDAHDFHTSKETSEILKSSIPYQWLNLMNDSVPPDFLPLFAALSPFLVQPGLQFPQIASQIQAFPQYLPFLSFLANSNSISNSIKFPFTHHENREVSITKISNGEFSPSRCKPRTSSYVPQSKNERKEEIKSLPNIHAENEASPTLKYNKEEYESSDSEDCATKIASEIHSTQGQRNKASNTREDSFQSQAKNDVTKLKAIFIDRLKRCSSPEAIQSNNKKFKTSGTPIHITNSFNDTVSPHQEQNEPIDLSVKNCQVLSKPVNNFSSVLACSMTVTPLESYHNSTSTFLASSDGKSFLVDDGKETEDHEKGPNTNSAINLSCHG